MSIDQCPDLYLLTWNILAPCWVSQAWYPSLYEFASNYQDRMNKVANQIFSLMPDVVLIQEAQEDIIPLLKRKLEQVFLFHFTSNNPTSASIANGLLTLIRMDWTYSSQTIVLDGILDLETGEAIQIMTIPSKNIHIVNLHLDYANGIYQGKKVNDKCQKLLNTVHPVTIIAGDLNATIDDVHDRFEWNNFREVFRESVEDKQIATYYPDPSRTPINTVIDHIFYDPLQIKLIESGKAWSNPNASLKDALTQLGSDHIYIWASFKFCQSPADATQK